MVVNLFAGPGAGKSTTAAGVFCLLKMHNIKCELVTEYAKQAVWREWQYALTHQYWVSANQRMALDCLDGKVDIAITDSPVILGLLYGDERMSPELRQELWNAHEQYPTRNYFINRTKPYRSYGRNQNEDEAKDLDIHLRRMLITNGVPVKGVTGDWYGINYIVRDILRDTPQVQDYFIMEGRRI